MSKATENRQRALSVLSAIANRAELTETERGYLWGAIVTRGNRAGQLKRRMPSGACGLSQAAWLGVQPNPWKVSFSALVFLRGDEKALYEKLARFNWPGWLDQDRAELVSLGVW
jgi:hypothetical protein